MFGFGKNKKHQSKNSTDHENTLTSADTSSDVSVESAAAGDSVANATDDAVLTDVDSVAAAVTSDAGFVEQSPAMVHTGDTSGPYDGDTVNIQDFDFSDFSENILDLGSLKIALPQRSQVQVEMGDSSPKMLHILTEYGRITPIAFATAKTSGLWNKALVDIADDLRKQGLSVTSAHGPWGEELLGHGDGGTIRVIGVDGPRWMLRFTALSPNESADRLAELTRQVMAHTFVYRGTDAILAGSALPVILPQEIMEQLMAAMQQGAGQPGSQAPGSQA